MSDRKPVRYDPETRTVHTEKIDEHGVWPGATNEDYFIEQAVHDFYFYDERGNLQWAVEQGLPGVMESAPARVVIAKLVHDGMKRKRGDRPSVKKRAAEQHMAVLKRVWHYQAQGLPVYVNPESESAPESTACGLAAHDCDCSPETVLRVWRDAGGHNPKGAYLIAATLSGLRPKKK